MSIRKKKGFTLIELIAVLVILAILALIVTPLVMNIIRKAKTAADKRSIDAYGRSIELAIAGFLLDNGTFPTSIEQLTIEYSGDEVVCSTTNLNSDSSVYLAGCTVGGRSVEGYSYGKEEEAPTYAAYSVGDELIYNNISYYVIEDSSETDAYVTLLKAEPLTTSEVNQYGVGHINRYTVDNQGAVYDNNGYGGMAYYSSPTCGPIVAETSCATDYAQSEVKYVVDAWKTAKAPLAIDSRLITFEELRDNLGYTFGHSGTSMVWHSSDSTPSWVYDSNSFYWTMSKYEDSSSVIYDVERNGHLNSHMVTDGETYGGLIRPVIKIIKTVFES